MATQWNYFFMARWLPSTPQQYLIPFYIFQEISGKLQFNLVKVCPATDETYKKHSFPCFYEIHNTRQPYTQTHTHTQSHTHRPPLCALYDQQQQVRDYFVSPSVPGRAVRQWPTPLQAGAIAHIDRQSSDQRTHLKELAACHQANESGNGHIRQSLQLSIRKTSSETAPVGWQLSSKFASLLNSRIPRWRRIVSSSWKARTTVLLITSSHLIRAWRKMDKSADDEEQKWLKLWDLMWLSVWKAIVVRLCEIVRMRSNTFPPHMRNTVTADCHSFRGQQISTIISQKGNNLWWKVKPEITGSEIWFKKWLFLLKVCCMLWGKEVAMKR